MKKSIWIVVVLILVLALGLETDYFMRGRKEAGDSAASDIYHAPVTQRVNPASAPVSTGFQNDPFQVGGDPDNWDPFEEMENMQKTMNRMFRDSFSRGLVQSGGEMPHQMSYDPDIDIKDAGKEYVIRIDLPGIDKDKVSVKVENNQLIISGERKTENEETQSSGNFYRSERSFGSFMRAVPFPPDSDADRMMAQSADGVLTVRIPKLAAAKQNTGS